MNRCKICNSCSRLLFLRTTHHLPLPDVSFGSIERDTYFEQSAAISGVGYQVATVIDLLQGFICAAVELEFKDADIIPRLYYASARPRALRTSASQN